MEYDKYSGKYIDSLGDPSILNKRLTWRQQTKKDNQWMKDCINFIDSQYYCYQDIANLRRLQMNYDLANGHGEKAMEEYGKHQVDLPEDKFGNMNIYGNIQHHPVIQQVYKAMVGEQQLRPLTPLALDTSAFSMSQARRKRLQMSQEYLHEQIIAPAMARIKAEVQQQYTQQNGIKDLFKLDPQQQMQMQADIEQRTKAATPKEIQDYMRKDYKSPSSIQAQKILDFAMHDLNIKFITDENFKNLIIAGKEIYRVGIRNGKTFLELVNPMGFFHISRPNALFIEEGVCWKYEQQIMFNDLHAWHGEEIGNSNELRDKLDHISYSSRGRKFGEPNPQMVVEVARGNTDIITKAPDIMTREGQEFLQAQLLHGYGRKNQWGDIRHVHCAWKGLRRLKQIKRYNPDNDRVKSIWIDESYVFNPTKTDENGYRDVEEYICWAPCIFEGSLVQNDIYLGVGPVEYQYKSLDNPWEVKGPYVGGTYSKLMNNTEEAAPMDPAKAWQFKFNLQMARIHELEATDLGTVLHTTLNSIPEGWSFEQYFLMMKYGKLAISDNTREGWRPEDAQMIKQLDLSTTHRVAEKLQYLDYIRNQIILSMDYNPSRLGLQGPTVAVTNNQQNIIQSSYQTNDVFNIHNKIVENLLNVVVDVEKVSLRENDSLKGYVLDDLSIADLDLNWELIDGSEINVKIVNSSEEYQNVQEIKQLMQPMVQNGLLSLPDLIRVGFSKSKAELLNFAEQAQEASEKRMQQAQSAQEQLMQQQQQMAMQMEQMRKEFELQKQANEHNMRIQEALIESSWAAQQMDIDRNKIPDTLTLERAKQEFELKKLEKEHQFKSKEHEDEMRLKEKEFQLEKDLTQTKLEIERIKARSKPKTTSSK